MAVRIGVGLGLGGFPFESIGDFRRWLDVCEDSEIDSIWQSDRVVSREPAFEPMTLLSVVAGATRRLKFGTNAVVLPFRDPVTFARQCATLDTLSDGRFLPTVGVGRGDAPEWEATGRSSSVPSSQTYTPKISAPIRLITISRMTLTTSPGSSVEWSW